MKKLSQLIGVFIISLGFQATAIRAERPLFLTHFMPWHQTPDISGYWGYHWTMNHFDPNTINDEGQRDIASHYYPLTGPYDSEDPDILEYQVLLMKISGIDGVLVDWYGMEDFWDYAVLNDATHALFEYIKKAKLQFAIVYEDQTIGHMINNDHLQASMAISHGQEVMQYLQSNWFEEEAYVNLGDSPLLLTFGPQYYKNSSQWKDLFSVLSKSPLFITLDNRLAPAATAAYPWPPMWKSGADGVLSNDELQDYLDQFYAKAVPWQVLVTSAFPRFHDIYKQAGVNDGYGRLYDHDGETFRSTLQQAIDHDPDVVQLVTWNDYGEGTIIEPTVEFGNAYLKIVQQFRNRIDSTFAFEDEDLRLPLRVYHLRRQSNGDPDINTQLDSAFQYIVSGDMDRATQIVTQLDGFSSIQNEETVQPANIELTPNHPNPFNPSTTFSYQTTTAAQVKLEIFNTLGQPVEVLVNEQQHAGSYTITWHASDISSGVYLYRLSAGTQTITAKCLKID